MSSRIAPLRKARAAEPATAGAHLRPRGRGWQALGALFLLAVSVYAHAAVRAQFDRPAVREGDTVTLVIESDARSSDKPDLSSLGRDFDVLGTSTSTQLSFVNGHRSDLTRWLVQLQPRHAGTIDVAPITVGGERTAALSLDVRTANAQAPGDPNDPGRHVIVESEIGARDGPVYVQQQIPYTVRLYYDDAVQAGDLTAPRADDAMMEKLGEDRRYTATRDGHNYNVIERRYAVAAEKSGSLVIPPAMFRGRVAAAGPGGDDNDDMLRRFMRNSPFANDPAFRDQFLAGRLANAGQPISARSRDIALDVRPRPAAITGPWLPADAVTLHDSWTDSPPQFKVGEPVKRTITVDAKGLAASQIPSLDIATPDNARVYPETIDNQSRTDGNAVYGIRQQTITYIATAEGALTVPPIEIDWWNTQNDRESRASLPQRSFAVLPGVASVPPATATAKNAPNTIQSPLAAPPAPVSAPRGPHMFDRLRASPGYALLAGATLVILMVALWTWLRRRHARAAPATPSRLRDGTIDPRVELQRACIGHDPHAALRALLAMARTRWPDDPPRALRSLMERLGGRQDVLTDLESALYGVRPGEWHADTLWKTFANGFARVPARRDTPAGAKAAKDDELQGVEELYR